VGAIAILALLVSVVTCVLVVRLFLWARRVTAHLDAQMATVAKTSEKVNVVSDVLAAQHAVIDRQTQVARAVLLKQSMTDERPGRIRQRAARIEAARLARRAARQERG
jgi:hypothetical protein